MAVATLASMFDEANHNWKVAQAWARLGMRVIPWRYVGKDKRPSLTGWPQLATSDTATLHEQWDMLNGACYPGIACCRESGWLIDLDDAVGMRSWMSLCAQHPDDLPQPALIDTSPRAGGGLHLWFSYPQDGREIVTAASVIAPGVDTRGWHGFGVAPGTRTFAGEYRILAPADGNFTMPPLRPAPRWLEDLAERGQHDHVWEKIGGRTGLDYSAWLDNAINVIEGQYHYLFRGFCSMRYFCMDPAEMAQWGYQAAVRFYAAKPHREPPWSHELVDKKLSDVLNRYPPGSQHTPMIGAK